MPQGFALEMDRTQREHVVVHSLLSQVPGVRAVTIDKLHAAGLSTLDTLFLASAAEIVHTTGIATDLAERIAEKFAQYKKELRSAAPDATRAQEREKLSALAAKLKKENDAYDAAAEDW